MVHLETFRSNRGFSMTEVSLALLVIAIGLMAVIGLFPASLDQGRKAIEDTQALFFADSVFASLKGAQMHIAWDQLDTYEHIPPNTISDANGVNPWQAVLWDDPDRMTFRANDALNSIVFDALLSDDSTIRDHALSYQLSLEETGRIYRVVLKLWYNEFVGQGKINPVPDPQWVFYTELFNYGM